MATSALVVGIAPSESASAAPPATWLTAVDVCPAPSAHAASCMAMRLIRSTVKSKGAVRAPRVVTRHYTVGPAGGYTPATVAGAYGVNANTATTQTVAIVDAYQDPNIKTDLNAFNAANGIPAETATSFTVVSQTGGAASTVPLDTTGWTVEQALDVDAVRGLCHKCKILLVEANSSNDSDLGTAENYAAAHANIVSNSFGLAESFGAPPASYVSAFNHPGKAILASTGDDGWYDWDYANSYTHPSTDRGPATNSPASPASLNTVIAVGGTALYLNANGTRASEDVWNENGPSDNYGFGFHSRLGATGGGCSTRYSAQPWQSHVAGYSTLGCGTKRSTGDIAALADPSTGYDVYTTYHYGNGAPNGWTTVGGTSLASPLVAAMFGLAGGPHGVKYPALTLYGHYKSARATYDVTVGGNGACSTSTPQSCALSYGENPNTFYSPSQLQDCAFGSGASATPLANRYQCHANIGYDGPSGVGTPKGLTTFAAMKPTASITNPGTVTHNVTKKFDGSLSSDPFPGGTITSYAWKFGDGGTATGSKPSHKYTHKGVIYTITLTVTDSYGLTGTITRKIKTA